MLRINARPRNPGEIGPSMQDPEHREAGIPDVQQLEEGWTTGFEPATAWTTTRSSTN